jgi:signal transduction histidine kinase
VFQTGRPARIDDYATATGPGADLGRAIGMRSAVGVPISVDGRPWGVINVASTREEPPSPDTEARLAGFTELVATALANAEAGASLAASRARIVAAADTARRRIQRDLHDGVQQRLVSMALQLRGMAPPPGSEEFKAQLDEVAVELTETIDEVRELARGIHPSVLAKGGLRPALTTLARRSVVAAELDVRVERRLPAQAEIAAYYVVSEALTNAAKHSHASLVQVRAEVSAGSLHVTVSDNGVGGADPSMGSGLIGLNDRVDALGGTIVVASPPGEGTTLELTLPI